MTYNSIRNIKIYDFINNSISALEVPYTICDKCNGFDYTNECFTDRCFGCLFCLFENCDIYSKFKKEFGEDFIDKYASQSFKGDIVEMPCAKKTINNDARDLEEFTNKDETGRIQPWTAGIIDHTCSVNNIIGMEIYVKGISREDRLDVCAYTDTGYLLVIETKVSLEKAFEDERFIDQHNKYNPEIEKCTRNYLYLTLLGGIETDLLPENHSLCTGKKGRLSSRLYSIVIENGIRFISANALWCMCCKYMKEGNKFAWDIFLKEIFNDKNCVGLLSAGKIIKQDDEFVIEPV